MPVTKVCPRCGEEFDEAIAFCAKDGTRLVKRGQQTDLIGSVVADRYRIVSAIGEGGMGQVYLAEHVRMKRKSAIKIMRHALVGDVEALQRFTREAENASQIAHPNVAAIFDFGETTDGIVYLAMEFVDGEALAAKLGRDLALHPDVAADILGQAADALQAAHDLGILHRDLKPDNIMLAKRPDGTYMVKLVDFGIARTMDGGDQKVTRTGFAIGTPAFMSPEQLAGDVLDARSDQYSLALVAFMALTGKDAFPAESSKESLIARLTSRPRTLQEAKEDVQWPAALQAIFDRALSPEPTDRYPTVSDFAHALSGAISNMTPTQTAELYRRALDVRIANVAMRTPHSDLQALRTPNSPLATVTPSERPTVERRGDERPDERRATERNEPAFIASGAYPPLAGVSAAASGGVPVYQGADPTQVGAPVEPRKRGVSIPAIAGGVITVAVVALYLSTRGDAVIPPSGDSLAAVQGAPVTDSLGTVAVNALGAGASAAGAIAGGSTSAMTPAALDSAKKKAAADSLKKAEKWKADSTKRRKEIETRFPTPAVRALVGGNVNVRDYSMIQNDVRLTVMPPQVTAWRLDRALRWKEAPANARPDGAGAWDIADPIEVWSAWKTVSGSRRPVYVVEVAPDRAPWPVIDLEKVYDMKRGDVAQVRMTRDGAELPLENALGVPAVAREEPYLAQKKQVPTEILATLPADAFMPKADGSMPKFEVFATFTRSGPVKFTMPDNLVRRLWDDFKPYRDALAAPILPTPTAPAPGAKPAAAVTPPKPTAAKP